MIDPAERGAITRLHALGLLGVTGVGWLVAAAYSLVQLAGAIQRRAALLTLQAAQAALFQLAAALMLLLLIALVLAGFMLLGGQVPELPELPVVDPFSGLGYAVMAVWVISILAVPAWFVWSLLQALRAMRASAAGEIYAYPFVGRLVWEEAPRVLRWLVVEEAPDGEDPDGETPSADMADMPRRDHRDEEPLLESRS